MLSREGLPNCESSPGSEPGPIDHSAFCQCQPDQVRLGHPKSLFLKESIYRPTCAEPTDVMAPLFGSCNPHKNAMKDFLRRVRHAIFYWVPVRKSNLEPVFFLFQNIVLFLNQPEL